MQVSHTIHPLTRSLTAAMALLAAPLLQADVLGGSIGGNLWLQSFDAQAQDGGDVVDYNAAFDVDDEVDYHLYASFEHPLPLLPNILLQHTRATTNGTGVLGSTFFDGVTLEGEVTGELELTHTDFTAYYEVLDNWLNLDIGLTARKFDANATLAGEDGTQARASTDDILPMLYTKAQFDLPFTGWKFKAGGNYINYGGDTVYDLSGAVGWEVIAGLELELGYRQLSIDYSDDDELLDAEVKGIYGGILWDF